MQQIIDAIFIVVFVVAGVAMGLIALILAHYGIDALAATPTALL